MLLSIAARVAVASRGQSLPLARQHRPPQSALSQRVSASNPDLGGVGSVPQNTRLVTPAIRAVCARRGLRLEARSFLPASQNRPSPRRPRFIAPSAPEFPSHTSPSCVPVPPLIRSIACAARGLRLPRQP